MNPLPSAPAPAEDVFEAVAPPMSAIQMDDDFEDEELGERPVMCSMEPGCTTCE